MEILISLGVGVFCVLLDKLADQIINHFKRKRERSASTGSVTNNGQVISTKISVSVDSLIEPCEQCRREGVAPTNEPEQCPPTGLKS